MNDYHAHIYFSEETLFSALGVRHQMLEHFSSVKSDLRVGNLITRGVGPHPLPMFEVNFKKEVLNEIILWLETNRKDHVVLIHPVTGNDPKDHTLLALWLGDPLQLDMSKLDPV